MTKDDVFFWKEDRELPQWSITLMILFWIGMTSMIGFKYAVPFYALTKLGDYILFRREKKRGVPEAVQKHGIGGGD